MKATTADRLLHRLLDSYERRADPSGRAISAGMDQLPGYLDDQDAAIRHGINRTLADWEQHGWVRLRWVRGEAGNLLERVTLQVDAVPEIYAYLKRTPITSLQNGFTKLVERYHPQVSAQFAAILDDMLVHLEKGKSIAPFQLDNPSKNEDMLRVLAALATLDDELPERDFSARVLGDSKRLAALKSSLLVLIRHASPDWTGLREEDVWASIGLLPNPGHVYVHGPLVFRLKGAVVDASVFQPDMGISIRAISEIELVSVAGRYVLTIENRTSFYDYIAAFPNDGLVLYLGGFPNHARRRFLYHLSEFAPTMPFYHWGDLDYGGLAILSHLRSALNRPVFPHQMDVAILEQYRHAARPLNASDRRNLSRLLTVDVLQDTRQVIRAMLAQSIKLEQEVILPKPPSFSAS